MPLTSSPGERSGPSRRGCPRWRGCAVVRTGHGGSRPPRRHAGSVAMASAVAPAAAFPCWCGGDAVKAATSTDPDGTYRSAFGRHIQGDRGTHRLPRRRAQSPWCDRPRATRRWIFRWRSPLAPRARGGSAGTKHRALPAVRRTGQAPTGNGRPGSASKPSNVQTQAAAAAGVEPTETRRHRRAPAAAAGILDRRSDRRRSRSTATWPASIAA